MEPIRAITDAMGVTPTTGQSELQARLRRAAERGGVLQSEQPATTCERCDGTGWETIDVDGVKRVTKCTGCLVAITPYGLPEEGKGITLADYGTGKRFKVTPENSEALRHAQFFVDGVHPGMYLWGGCGSGKTILACAILNTLSVPGGPGLRFVRLHELMHRMVGLYDDDPDRKQGALALFDSTIDVGVLVLDDIGAQKGSDFSRRVVEDIFDRRLDRNRRTLFTSNSDLDALQGQMGDRIPSRIAGWCKVVELDGVDWRIRQAAERDAAAARRR